MAIDPLSEETISLSAAAKLLPKLRAGKSVSASTLWRWATAGLKGRRLQVVRCGGTTVTSASALREFFAALGGEDGLPSALPAAAARCAENVERELQELGI